MYFWKCSPDCPISGSHLHKGSRLEQLGQGVREELESGDRIVQAYLESENGMIIDNSSSVNPNSEQHTSDRDVMDVVPTFCRVSISQSVPPSKPEPSHSTAALADPHGRRSNT